MQPDLWPLILFHLKLPEQAIARRIEVSARDAVAETSERHVDILRTGIRQETRRDDPDLLTLSPK